MYHCIRSIPIKFESRKIISFNAQPLCKILEVEHTPAQYSNLGIWNEITPAETKVVILERWGQTKAKEKQHHIIIMRPGEVFEFTPAYEPVLSRRGKVKVNNVIYYVFSIG